MKTALKNKILTLKEEYLSTIDYDKDDENNEIKNYDLVFEPVIENKTHDNNQNHSKLVIKQNQSLQMQILIKLYSHHLQALLHFIDAQQNACANFAPTQGTRRETRHRARRQTPYSRRTDAR